MFVNLRIGLNYSNDRMTQESDVIFKVLIKMNVLY